jgi:spore coat protein U-like protein
MLFCGVCGAWQAAAQTCSLTVSTLNFGTYTGALLNSTATGAVNCSGAWDIPLNAGIGAGATETIRKMTSLGGATLNYQLFTDSTRHNNWGNTTGNELTGTGNTNITVYGQILANQTVVPGTYTDTVSSATTSFTVIVFIQATCAISATTLAFGNYSGVLINSTSALTVTCTNKTVFDIGLDAGTHGGSVTTRKMMVGTAGSTLNYSIFRNSGRTLNWGNTVGTDILQSTATGAAVQYTVYGQLPAGQPLTPGTYSDTIAATVTY